MLFWSEICRRPRQVGALCPSSRYLARAIADSIPPGEGLVVELGPGTGTVTSALLERGMEPEKLVLIERSPAFCALLRTVFPRLLIIQGDAGRLSEYLERHFPGGASVRAIVSCLPLMVFPEEELNLVLAETAKTIAAGGCLVQFTYGLFSTSPYLRSGLCRDLMRFVPLNLPPAKVERFLSPKAARS